MYVATFSLEHGPWLIRVDVVTRVTLFGPVHLGHYIKTDSDGVQHDNVTTLGPDVQGVGLPTLAVIDLIRDLNFAGIDGGINLVHSAPCFTQDDLDQIIGGMGAGLAIQSLATSATVQ